MVRLGIRRDVSTATIERVLAALVAQRTRFPGIRWFAGGAYSSTEGLAKQFTRGFVMSFGGAAARYTYLKHPGHEWVKKQVLAKLDDGLEGVVAFDFES
jgi:hypothetical protein